MHAICSPCAHICHEGLCPLTTRCQGEKHDRRTPLSKTVSVLFCITAGRITVYPDTRTTFPRTTVLQQTNGRYKTAPQDNDAIRPGRLQLSRNTLPRTEKNRDRRTHLPKIVPVLLCTQELESHAAHGPRAALTEKPAHPCPAPAIPPYFCVSSPPPLSC